MPEDAHDLLLLLLYQKGIQQQCFPLGPQFPRHSCRNCLEHRQSKEQPIRFGAVGSRPVLLLDLTEHVSSSAGHKHLAHFCSGMPVCQSQERSGTGVLGACANSITVLFQNLCVVKQGPLPRQTLGNTSQTAAAELNNAVLHLTYKHGLSPLLDQEELSPISTASFHSKNDQVAC